MTTVVGNIRVLQDAKREIDEESRRQAFADLEEHAHRLEMAIQNLLAMGRLDIGDRPYLEPTVLPILVGEVVPSRCRRGGTHLVVGAPGLDSPVAVDRNLFRILLTNLIENACLYSPHGSTVTIVTSQQGESTVVSVLDEGPGVDSEELPLLFERYYRSPRVVETKPGLGIGLSVAKKIAELHAGELVGRNRQTRGACFEVLLPQLTA